MGIFGPPDIEKLAEKRNVRGLIKALSYKDASIRRKAAEALGELGNASAVEPLIAALKDNSEEYVRRTAATALGEIGDARAVDPLITALKDNGEIIRGTAAEALGEIGDVRAVKPLIAALKYDNWIVRKHAAEALGEIGDARAVEPLIAALKDDDEDVRNAAAEALENMGWQPGEDEDGARYWIAKGDLGLCEIIGAPAVGLLIDVLCSDSEQREIAAVILGKIGDARAVQPLIAALRDNTLLMRMCAAVALGEIGDERAVQPLLAVLKDDDVESVRRDAAEALGKLGDARAVEPLIAALKDNYGGVRSAAAEALGKLGDTCAVEPLVDVFNDDNLEVCLKALEALVKICDARAESLIAVSIVKPLIKKLTHHEYKVRTNAAHILVHIYQSGVVDETTRKAILGVRPTITEPVHTRHEDKDYRSGSSDCHWDETETIDGIGVEFPV